MLAANMMTTGFTRLLRDQTVLDALNLLAGQKSVAAPVVDLAGLITGIVSLPMLLRAAFAAGGEGRVGSSGEEGTFPCSVTLGPVHSIVEDLVSMHVSEVMDKEFITVTPDTPAESVVACFLNEMSSALCIPVVDNQKRLLGVITPAEITVRLCEYLRKNHVL